MSNREVRQPRVLGGREEERWRDEISRRTSSAQPAEANESLLWLFHEDRNAENVRNISDIDGVDIKAQMIAFSEQTVRDIDGKVRDLEINGWQMATFNEQAVRDIDNKVRDLEISHWMGV